jgi:hypothetical protein
MDDLICLCLMMPAANSDIINTQMHVILLVRITVDVQGLRKLW